MNKAQRLDVVMGCAALIAMADEARRMVVEESDQLAEAVLKNMDDTILFCRNAIGQWENRVICPRCRKTGRVITHLNQWEAGGIGFVGVGFKCEHCAHAWGADKPEEAS